MMVSEDDLTPITVSSESLQKLARASTKALNEQIQDAHEQGYEYVHVYTTSSFGQFIEDDGEELVPSSLAALPADFENAPQELGEYTYTYTNVLREDDDSGQ